MAARNVKGHKVLFVNIIVSIFILMMCGGAFAKIPEPDNIIYGIAGDDAVAVSLEVDGQQIASYTMGENPNAGAFYILRAPLDSLDPPEPGSARVGDEAAIFLKDEASPVTTVIIGERGSIQKLHLGGDDSDVDGLPDAEEDYLGTNPRNRDTDGDGLSDAAEVDVHHTQPLLSDSDSDGYSDGHEIGAQTSPLSEDELPVVYVDAGNTSGVEQGTMEDPFQTIAAGIGGALEKYVVLVASGTYDESVIIDKDIKLIGESPSTTIIDANDLVAVDLDYSAVGDEIASIEKFTIRNADTGINCGLGTSPLIRNNIITGIDESGIFCDIHSTARIINNTIAGNATATGIQSDSSDIAIINNIISNNNAGIECEGGGLRIDYNNLWHSIGGEDYVGSTLSGPHDISAYPNFVSGSDYHLLSGSLCLDAGDPVETLTGDYTTGSTLTVNESTNLAVDDRMWITDGSNTETDIITGSAAASVDISGEFMNSYLIADSPIAFTMTSDASKEPAPGDSRVDMGAYGNTGEAGPTTASLFGDSDGDDDVDGKDLGVFAENFEAGVVGEPELKDFAEHFGK